MIAATLPKSSAGGYASPSAKDLITWGCAVFVTRYVASGLRDLWRGPGISLGHLADFGVFQLLAWMAVFILLRRSGGVAKASGCDIIIASASLLTVLLPSDNAGWLGMSVLACYVLVAFQHDRYLRSAAVVIAALATQLFWGRMLFKIVAFKIEVIDASLADGLLSLLHHTVSQQGNILTTGTHEIAIYQNCTSFHNVSIAMLCWVTITKLVRTNWHATDIWTAFLLVVTTVAMNSLRLFLMASSASNSFDFWHTGIGASMINASSTLLVVAVCLFGALEKSWNR